MRGASNGKKVRRWRLHNVLTRPPMCSTCPPPLWPSYLPNRLPVGPVQCLCAGPKRSCLVAAEIGKRREVKWAELVAAAAAAAPDESKAYEEGSEVVRRQKVAILVIAEVGQAAALAEM